MDFPVHEIRKLFPILDQKIHNKPLVYLDNGATTQKPLVVIEFEKELYSSYNSNIHRGVHFLSQKMTDFYEQARKTVQLAINAKFTEEIIFTSGATMSINTIAFSFGEQFIHPGDEILISTMEHHANIVPWQMMCQRKGAVLKVIPINLNGELNLEKFRELLSNRTKILAITHVSNTLGTINPIAEMIEIAHGFGTKVLIDGSQSIQHQNIDVQILDCDFFVFSGHKVYGPTGIGVLYGKKELLNAMPPYMGGGDMIDRVSFDHTTYNELPLKFEAGTTNYIGAIAMSKGIELIREIGIETINAYEHQLLEYATERLNNIGGITIYGTSTNKAPIISFLIDGIHPYDTGMILDKLGIAVRTGTHCTQPLMSFLRIEGTVRASMAFYNTMEEIDIFIEGIIRVKNMF